MIYRENGIYISRRTAKVIVFTFLGIILILILEILSPMRIEYPSKLENDIPEKVYNKYFLEAELAFNRYQYSLASELYDEYLEATNYYHYYSPSDLHYRFRRSIARNRKAAVDLIILLQSK